MTHSSASIALHERVMASAGSGKTYQLVSRYLRLIATGAEPGVVHAVTFTRAAAGEMRSRILVTLARAAVDARERAALEQRLGCAISAADARSLLARLAKALHRMQVRTIDSLFIAIARACVLELGLPPRFAPADERDLEDLHDQALRAAVDTAGHERLVSLLADLTDNSAETAVAAAVHRAVRTLHTRAAEAPPHAWSWLPQPEFPREGALADAAQAIIALGENAPTKHHAKAYAKDADRIAAADWAGLLKGGIASFIISGKTVYQRHEIDAHTRAAYTPVLRHLRAMALDQQRRRLAATRELVEHFAHALWTVKQARGLLEFDDIALAVARAMRSDSIDGLPERQADRFLEIALRLDGAIHHLLIDEMQDTSVPQWLALEPLVREITSREDRSFFAVGDVKQSIYAWREGEPAILAQLPRLIAPGELVERTLAESRRSAPPVIEAVNVLFGSLRSNPALHECGSAVDAWLEGFEPHTTVKRDAGHVAVHTAESESDHRTALKPGWHRAVEIAADLRARMPDDMTVAVLVRRRAAANGIAAGLRARGIRASSSAGAALIDNHAVSAVTEALRLADHPDDTAAAYHVARSALGRVLRFADHADAPQRHDLSRRVRGAVMRRGAGWFVARILRSLARRLSDEDHDALRELMQVASTLDRQGPLRPIDYVRAFERASAVGLARGSVAVMTIHAAKGLEFDAVVVANLEQQLIRARRNAMLLERDGPAGGITRLALRPGVDWLPLLPELKEMIQAADNRALHEALCLLYVAMTRAKRALHMVIERPRNLDEHAERFGEVIRGAFQRELAGEALTPGSVITLAGDPAWLGSRPQSRQAASPGAPASSEALPARTVIGRIPLAPARTDRPRGRTAPPASQRAAEPTASGIAVIDPDALDLGRAVHAMLADIEFLPPSATTAVRFDIDRWAALARAATNGTRGIEWCTRCAHTLAAQINAPAILRLFTPPSGTATGKSVSVWRELPFVYDLGDGLVRGSIDRLEAEADERGVFIRARVVDFKTEAVDEADAAARAERFRAQVEVYRTAAAHLLRVHESRISMHIAFMAAGCVVELPVR